jgi:hypothetical protein
MPPTATRCRRTAWATDRWSATRSRPIPTSPSSTCSPARRRLRHRLRRRAGARAGRWRQRGQDRVLRRRQVARGNARGAGSRHPLLQRRIASELEQLNESPAASAAARRCRLRVNPDVDAKTHPYISTGSEDRQVRRRLRPGLRHLPSRRVPAASCREGHRLPHRLATARPGTRRRSRGQGAGPGRSPGRRRHRAGTHRPRRRHGHPVPPDEPAPAVADYLAPMLAKLAGRREKLVFEPGRSLVGNAGLLLTRVQVLKPGEEKHFAVVDAAMNDLMRPALYDAWHDIVPVATVGAGDTAAMPMKSSARSANRAISSATTANWPCGKATCSPSSRPAPTAWPWHRTTTAGRAPPRSWSMAMPRT